MSEYKYKDAVLLAFLIGSIIMACIQLFLAICAKQTNYKITFYYTEVWGLWEWRLDIISLIFLICLGCYCIWKWIK